MDGGVESPAPVVDRSRMLFNNLKNHTLKGVGYEKTDSIAEQILYTLTLPIMPPVALAAAGIWVGEKAYSAAKSEKVRQAAETIERNLSIVLSKSMSKVTSKSEITPLSTLNKSPSTMSQKMSHLPSQSSQQGVKGLVSMLQLSATECKLINDPSSVDQQSALVAKSPHSVAETKEQDTPVVPSLKLSSPPDKFVQHSELFESLSGRETFDSLSDRKHFGCKIKKKHKLGNGSDKIIYPADTPIKELPVAAYAKYKLDVKSITKRIEDKRKIVTDDEIEKERNKIIIGAKKEFAIQKRFNTETIVKVYFIEVLSKEGTPNLGILEEKCNGGDLFDFVVNGQFLSLSSDDRWQLIVDAFTALAYLEKEGVHHRDIKLENFLLHWDEEKKKNRLKLGDFGYADFIEDERAAPVSCGSPVYVAPEFLNGHDEWSEIKNLEAKGYKLSKQLQLAKEQALDKVCSLKTDMWGMGIVLYSMRYGRPPGFIKVDDNDQGRTIRELYRLNDDIIDRSFPYLHAQGHQLEKFNRRLLRINPAERPSAAEGLELVQKMRFNRARCI